MSSRLFRCIPRNWVIQNKPSFNQKPVVRNIGRSCLQFSESEVNLKRTDASGEQQNLKKASGLTPEDAILVASPTAKCIVGCACSPDHPSVNWFYIREGEAQTCNCGYYFKLSRTEMKDWIPEYSQVMYVDESRTDPRLQMRRMPFFKGLFRDKTIKKVPVPPASMTRRSGIKDS